MRSNSWRATIVVQRQGIEAALDETPSLRAMLRDPAWQRRVWLDALGQAIRETGLQDKPDACPWSMDEARDPDFWPE